MGGGGWLELLDGKFLPMAVNGVPIMVKTDEGTAPVPIMVKKKKRTAPVQQDMKKTMPSGVPPGSELKRETYIGPMTTAFAVGGFLCCGCFACCICACPFDERDVYVAPGGTKYTAEGAKIEE